MALIHFECMSDIDQEALESRNKRTIWLLTGAGVSLLLPLLGLFFLRADESNVHPPSGTVRFDRREPGEVKVDSSQAIVPVKPVRAAPTPVKEDSSLRFIKGSGEYFKDKGTEPPASSPEPIAPAEAKAPVKGGKKSFAMPKLQGVKTFNSFKKGSQPAAGKEDVLKNLPPGAENNPEVLKYLKSR